MLVVSLEKSTTFSRASALVRCRPCWSRYCLAGIGVLNWTEWLVLHAGVQWGELDDAKYGCPFCRTCRFTGVCLNHSSLEIQYYKGANNAAPLFYDLTGNPHHTFPSDFINTGACPSLYRRHMPHDVNVLLLACLHVHARFCCGLSACCNLQHTYTCTTDQPQYQALVNCICRSHESLRRTAPL